MMFLEQSNLQKQKVEQRSPGEKEENKDVFNGGRMCIWDGETVLEMNHDSRTTL